MKISLAFILFISLFPSLGFSQQTDSLLHKLDSLSKKTDSAGGQTNNVSAKAYNETTKLSLPTYFTLLGSDLKQAFTKPFHMKGKDWARFGRFAVFTGALIFADEPIQRFAIRTTRNNPGVKKVSDRITTFGGIGEVVVLTTFGAYGYVFKKPKMVTTTLLATQAYITAGAVESVTKYLTGRTRPSAYGTTLDAEPKFYGPFSKPKIAGGSKSNSSFPSGHTTVVFAAATVFAKEYYDKPAVPIIAYSLATLVGLSRIVENAHWTTDVITGAALGFVSGRLIVNNYHRFAKIKAPSQNKNTVSFNLNYSKGILMPGFIYKFK